MIQPDSEQMPKLFSAADVLLGHLPDIRYVLGNIISEGSLTLLAGEAGSGKTFITLSLSACIAAGIDWVGMPTRQGATLYIDEESGNTRLRHRVRAVINGYEL